MVWLERIKMWCDIVHNAVNENGAGILSQQAINNNYCLIPLAVEPLQH